MELLGLGEHLGFDFVRLCLVALPRNIIQNRDTTMLGVFHAHCIVNFILELCGVIQLDVCLGRYPMALKVARFREGLVV